MKMRIHKTKRGFHPFFYRKRKFSFYSAEEIKSDPSKKATYAYAFVVDKNAPTFFIAPGGAYRMVCISYEGVFVAEELNRRGINAFVLNYRVKDDARAPHPQEDMAALIKFVFSNKDKFGIEREGYSVLGFSAGGHLAASFATENVGYKSFGLPAPKSCVLAYPVITMGEDTNRGTMETLTCCNETLREAYSVEKHIENYPPTFLWHCLDDKCVPPSNSINLAEGLKKNNIPCKLNLYKKGGHGGGLSYYEEAENWIGEALEFLREYL